MEENKIVLELEPSLDTDKADTAIATLPKEDREAYLQNVNLSDEEKADKTFQLTSNSFELYEQSFISDESLYEKKKAVKRTRNSELIMTEAPVDFEVKAKAAAMQVLNNKYSKKNVNEYVDRLLGDKNEITSREIAIENDDDYIMTLLSVVQANDRSSKYSIEFADEEVFSGKYEIPLMTYRKRGTK